MVWLPEEIANANVLSRVDPQYPKSAIDQHIQGQVVLDVEVGQTGVVRGVRAISGQTLLVAAATDALQRWRFRPYFVNGKPMNFETHVSVNFALP
jgi:protein TonB